MRRLVVALFSIGAFAFIFAPNAEAKCKVKTFYAKAKSKSKTYAYKKVVRSLFSQARRWCHSRKGCRLLRSKSFLNVKCKRFFFRRIGIKKLSKKLYPRFYYICKGKRTFRCCCKRYCRGCRGFSLRAKARSRSKKSAYIKVAKILNLRAHRMCRKMCRKTMCRCKLYPFKNRRIRCKFRFIPVMRKKIKKSIRPYGMWYCFGSQTFKCCRYPRYR